MSARARRIVSKVETDNGRVAKTEFHPEIGWLLVDGVREITIVERFRAQGDPVHRATTDWKPDDAIRIYLKQDMDGIEISVDRERGGVWWPMFDRPRLVIRFDDAFASERKIHVSVAGGDLKEPIHMGAVALLPAPKPTE
ncbi:MAG: hypothetical protein AAB759_03530 [Patescibacteria group bacterium]